MISWTRALLVFKARYLGGSTFLCRISGLECPVEPESLTLGKISFSVISPTCGFHGWDFFFFLCSDSLCLSSTSWCYPSTLCCGSSVHSVFKSLSEGVIPYIVRDLSYPWQEVSLRSSYTVIVNLSPTKSPSYRS